MVDQNELRAGMRELGISEHDILAILSESDYFICVDKLTELKDRVKKTFHKVALSLHPDRNNNDSVKTERFKVASNTMEYIDSLYIIPCSICIQRGRKSN